MEENSKSQKAIVDTNNIEPKTEQKGDEIITKND